LLTHGRWFDLCTLASSSSKTGRHDIAEILLKVGLNTGGRTHRFPHNNFSSAYQIFTKLGHMIPLWKGKNPIYFGVITIIPFDNLYRQAHGRWFSLGTPASSTTKTGRHDIAEILLKVGLNTINQIKSNQINQSYAFNIMQNDYSNVISQNAKMCFTDIVGVLYHLRLRVECTFFL
jgi:hypothetical protein